MKNKKRFNPEFEDEDFYYKGKPGKDMWAQNPRKKPKVKKFKYKNL
tara:strand:- start:2956 stop:3093 length:138 start_codon:yes stop_codon:yes gene_type:complete